ALETFENYLSSIKDAEKYRPGYVGLLVWLYEKVGKPENSVRALDQASTFWKSGVMVLNLINNHKELKSAFKLKTSRYREAAQDYEQLVKDDPLDIQALAGLVASYSQYDVNLAEKYESSLPDIIASMEIDVESLEKVVPGVKKNPERWLPKRDRSYNKKLRSKGKQQLMKGSQGVAVAGGGIGGTGSANIAGKRFVAASQPEQPAPAPTQKPKSGGT
ncbi:4810_t:CDS:2, partial [Racocetra fulgida]